MSLANGRFLSDLTEDANNPRGPLQRSYSGQKEGKIWRQVSEKRGVVDPLCDEKRNPCVKGPPYPKRNKTCECIAHDLCERTADGKNCVFVGAEGVEEIQKSVNFIKQLMNL